MYSVYSQPGRFKLNACLSTYVCPQRTGGALFVYVCVFNNAPEVRCLSMYVCSTTHRRCVVFFTYVCFTTHRRCVVLHAYICPQRTGGALFVYVCVFNNAPEVRCLSTYVCSTTHLRCVVGIQTSNTKKKKTPGSAPREHQLQLHLIHKFILHFSPLLSLDKGIGSP
jgi:hypothetical protein